MGYALIILLVVAYLVVVWLRRHPEKVQMWVARRMMRHMQKQARRQQAQAESEQPGRREVYERASRRRPRSRQEHIIPPEYAEDVHFTEVRTYSRDTDVDARFRTPGASARVQVEEQVSDVEWTDILPDGRPGKRHKVK